jgi:excisionase family DNA binding protein
MNATASAPRLTVRQVAERLVVREGTVRLWLGQGRLSRTSLGRAVRIRAEAVEELIATNTVPAPGRR